MSFGTTEYLTWIMRYFGADLYDLAASGIPSIALADLGLADLPASLLTQSLESPTAWNDLRARIATRNGTTADRVIPTFGATHAIFVAYATLLRPGDDVVVEAPAYEPMWRIAEGLGARVVRFERPLSTRCALDPERVMAALTPNTRLVAVTNLHNPSGARAPREVLVALASRLASRGVMLFVNEVYAPFDGLLDEAGTLLHTSHGLGPNVVTGSSLTKCFGLGPQRIGWFEGPPEVIARAADTWVSNAGHAPGVWMGVAVRAFDRLDALARRTARLLGQKRAKVDAWVRARPDFRWSAPEAGLFGFVEIPGEGDLTARIDAGAREHQVLVAPGAFFGVPNGFRLAWSIDEAKLDEALTRLSRVFPLTRG